MTTPNKGIGSLIIALTVVGSGLSIVRANPMMLYEGSTDGTLLITDTGDVLQTRNVNGTATNTSTTKNYRGGYQSMLFGPLAPAMQGATSNPANNMPSLPGGPTNSNNPTGSMPNGPGETNPGRGGGRPLPSASDGGGTVNPNNNDSSSSIPTGPNGRPDVNSNEPNNNGSMNPWNPDTISHQPNGTNGTNTNTNTSIPMGPTGTNTNTNTSIPMGPTGTNTNTNTHTQVPPGSVFNPNTNTWTNTPGGTVLPNGETNNNSGTFRGRFQQE